MSLYQQPRRLPHRQHTLNKTIQVKTQTDQVVPKPLFTKYDISYQLGNVMSKSSLASSSAIRSKSYT